MRRPPPLRRHPRTAGRAEPRKPRTNGLTIASRAAAPSRSGRHQAGQRLRPPAWSLSRSGLPRTNGPPYRPAMTKISTSAVASLISTRGARGVSHEEFAGPHARNPLARIFLCDVQQLASGQSRMASMAMPSHFGHLTPLAKLRQPSRNRSAHHAGLPRAPRSKAHGALHARCRASARGAMAITFGQEEIASNKVTALANRQTFKRGHGKM